MSNFFGLLKIKLSLKKIISQLKQVAKENSIIVVQYNINSISQPIKFIFPFFYFIQFYSFLILQKINKHKYKNVYLIAQDKNNPIIDKILHEYTSVIYKQNSIKKDISYLIYAYNIVASISSFLISIIPLNYNLKTLFDYNIYKLSEKILTYHYDL